MKKSDLKDGMIVELNCGEMGIILNNSIRYNVGFDRLNIFDDNLRFEDVTIDRIYKVTNDCCSIKEVLNKDNLTLMWKRPREIDWSKLPKWTKVRCKGEFGYYNAYHYEYIPNEIHCFGHTTRDEFTFVTDPVVDYLSKRDTYEIHPSIEIPEEWYKE